jgi:adenylate cyclase
LNPDPSTLVFGSIELRLAERVLRVEGEAVALGGRAFDLLQALVRRRERVVTKDELLDEVWPGLVVEENNLQVQISGLRRVLGAGAIATVAGIGYRWTLVEGSLPQPAPASVLSPPPAAAATVSARVLVADDNRVNRLLLCRSLELMGHQVGSAENGRQALAMMREQPFDLLLLDLAMPELDGFGLLEARLSDPRLCEVAVIVTSALGGVAPVARCIELGADDYLHKPVDPWLLKARVDSSLMRKQLRDDQAAVLRRALPAGAAGATGRPDATVLVSQLHGLQGVEPPQQALALLGDWGTLVFDAVQRQGGEVVQFCGHAVLALFEAPQAAAQAAQDLVDLLSMFDAVTRQGDARDGTPPRPAALRTGIGVARGPLVVGTATVAGRAVTACVGAVVMRAEALAAESAHAGQPWLLDDATRESLANPPLAG